MQKRYAHIFLIIFLIFQYTDALLNAQEITFPFAEIKESSFITTDPGGSLFVVREGNTLYRYNTDLKSDGYYNNIKNGRIAWVDASNPLKILVFYPQFSKIVILDKMLSSKAELDLKQIGLLSVKAVGLTDDGNIWVFDEMKAKLLKLNFSLQTIQESNDLRTETGTVPQPQSIISGKDKVYLFDSINGIYTFDRYGTYLSTLAIFGTSKGQVIDKQLIWLHDGKIYNYELQALNLKETPAPENALDVSISRDRIYYLYRDKIGISYLPKD